MSEERMVRVCANGCGEVLPVKDGPGGRQRYCSKRCANEAYWRRRLEREGGGLAEEVAARTAPPPVETTRQVEPRFKEKGQRK